jgi:hypothetical protein
MYKRLFLALIGTVSVIVAHAQLERKSIPVFINNQQLPNAWAGGHNFCQFSEIDINADGLKDLFVFDRSGNKVSTYINKGIPNQISYDFAPQYISKFPALENWVLLRDYNCDGKEDIFTSAPGGIAVFRNDSEGEDIKFTLVNPLILSYYMPNNAFNLYVSSVDIPAIQDIDGDGDMDIFTFNVFGSFIELHLNYSADELGNCDSLYFRLQDNCWGKFSEGMSGEIILNESCKSSEIGPRHAGSTLLALDLNKSGAVDIVLGDVDFPNLTQLINGGSSINGQISSYDRGFPTSTTPVNLVLFPASFYLDVNNDGIKDLLVSPNAPNVSENFQSIWYYQNLNKNDSALFQFKQNNFLLDGMIDVGEGAFPVMFDYDKDGKTDLFIGNHGYYGEGGNFSSGIAFFRNTGSQSNPSFDLVTRDFANISSLGFRRVFPAFGDLDGDGDMDMLIGEQNGRLHYFENIAGSGSVPSYQLTGPQWFNINIGQNSTPQLFDVNGDGQLDLIIGERNGSLNFIPNSGSINSPNFKLTDLIEFWGKMDVRKPSFVVGNSIPFIYSDGDDLKLLVGSEMGTIFLFDDITNNLTGTFNKVSDFVGNISEGYNASPTMADLDNDGQPELIVGNYAGGVTLYGYDSAVSINNKIVKDLLFNIFPVPASNHLYFETFYYHQGELVIYNSSGQRVLQKKMDSSSEIIDISIFAPGFYLVKFSNANGYSFKKIIIAR